MSTLSDIGDAVGIISGSEFRTQKPGIHLADIHPIATQRVHEAEGPSARALALTLAGKADGLIFWVATDGRARTFRARALRPYLDPAHFVCVEVANRGESLWAAEEALRCRGAGLVVLQIAIGPDLFESRRLQIAAQAGGTIGLVVIERRAQSSAAQTRWQCDTAIDASPNTDPDWRWSLTKNKQGKFGCWSVRGDPDPTLTTPLDLIPQTLGPRSDHDHFRLTTLPRALAATASPRPMAPA